MWNPHPTDSPFVCAPLLIRTWIHQLGVQVRHQEKGIKQGTNGSVTEFYFTFTLLHFLEHSTQFPTCEQLHIFVYRHKNSAWLPNPYLKLADSGVLPATTMLQSSPYCSYYILNQYTVLTSRSSLPIETGERRVYELRWWSYKLYLTIITTMKWLLQRFHPETDLEWPTPVSEPPYTTQKLSWPCVEALNDHGN